MQVQYQIMELDTEHLKKYEHIYSKRDRVCFIPAKLDNMFSNITGSFEEAVELIKTQGDDFKEYTIIPRIYMTNY